MKNIESKKYDLIVIGAGPAGLMTAGRAAENGLSVLVLEKNNRAGVKLLMTGHGRCNVTNDISPKEFVAKLGISGKFLFSALLKFGPIEVVDFFTSRGVKLKTEANGRVFPESNRAKDILDALLAYNEEGGVEIRYNSEVVKINCEDQKIISINLINGKKLFADSFAVTTGGLSYSATGSSGDGYHWAKALGHTLQEQRPGLTGIVVKQTFVKDLEGLSLKNITAEFSDDQGVALLSDGDMIFMANGMSGPLIHDLSKYIEPEFKSQLSLDLFPDLTSELLENKLQKLFHSNGGKQIKNCLPDILSPRLIPVLLRLAALDGDKKASEILKSERTRLVDVLKCFQFNILRTAGYEKANVTVGGVNLFEIDPKTMGSKIIPNLYFAGEVLDLDGPTGGFNLQIAWSTGYVAGDRK